MLIYSLMNIIYDSILFSMINTVAVCKIYSPFVKNAEILWGI